MYAASSPESRIELRERARRLRWTLAGVAGGAFAVAVGFVISNPIGTQAASPAPPATDQQAPSAPTVPQQTYQQPPVGYAPQQQPIVRTRRS